MERLTDSQGNPINKARWSSSIQYSIKDAFADPGDLSNKYPGNVEWLDCVPYEIIGSFSSLNTGEVWGDVPNIDIPYP